MIPTIEIASLFTGAGTPETDAAILRAARDIGFMTVTGLPGDALAPATRRKLLDIFALPDAAKRAMSRRTYVAENPNLYRGWFPLQEGFPTYKEAPISAPIWCDP